MKQHQSKSGVRPYANKGRTVKRKRTAPSPRVVDEAIRWKLKRLAEIPFVADALDAIGASIGVETRPIRGKKGRYRTLIALEMDVNATSAKKHVAHMNNPRTFHEDLAKVFSVVAIVGPSGDAAGGTLKVDLAPN